ncbi:unnamed protein product [Malus baccata var. baccata]
MQSSSISHSQATSSSCRSNLMVGYCAFVFLFLASIANAKAEGSSATPVAVKLMCSRKIPCDGVGLTDVDLTYIGSKGPLTSQCAYVKPYITRVANALACATWSYSNSLRSGRNLTNLLTR